MPRWIQAPRVNHTNFERACIAACLGGAVTGCALWQGRNADGGRVSLLAVH